MRTVLVLAVVTLALLGAALARPPSLGKRPPSLGKRPPSLGKRPPSMVKRPPSSPRERLLELLQSVRLVEALKVIANGPKDDLDGKSLSSGSSGDESADSSFNSLSSGSSGDDSVDGSFKSLSSSGSGGDDSADGSFNSLSSGSSGDDSGDGSFKSLSSSGSSGDDSADGSFNSLSSGSSGDDSADGSFKSLSSSGSSGDESADSSFNSLSSGSSGDDSVDGSFKSLSSSGSSGDDSADGSFNSLSSGSSGDDSADGSFKSLSSGSSGDDSGDDSGSSAWDWGWEDWVDYFKDVCGMSDDWPDTDGPLTPELLRGEVGDLADFVSQARDVTVDHRDVAEAVAAAVAGVDVSALTDEEFAALTSQHGEMFDGFMTTMGELSHGSMCVMMRVAHLRDRFEFEGDEGFAREDSCRDAHFLVEDAADLRSSVADRQFLLAFGNAMSADIQCAGNEIQEFADRIFSDYLVEADLAALTRRDVAARFAFIEQFLETTGREVYEFAAAVHAVGDLLEDREARALKIRDTESKIDKLGAMIKALEAAFATKH